MNKRAFIEQKANEYVEAHHGAEIRSLPEQFQKVTFRSYVLAIIGTNKRAFKKLHNADELVAQWTLEYNRGHNRPKSSMVPMP